MHYLVSDRHFLFGFHIEFSQACILELRAVKFLVFLVHKNSKWQPFQDGFLTGFFFDPFTTYLSDDRGLMMKIHLKRRKYLTRTVLNV